MPEYRRPSLLTANQVEVSQHLLAKAVEASTRKDDTAMFITIAGSSAQLDTAMADFPNTGTWRQALPAAVAPHVQHLADFLAASPAQLAALTQAQRDHATQDIIRAMKALVDDRLG